MLAGLRGNRPGLTPQGRCALDQVVHLDRNGIYILPVHVYYGVI